MDEWHIRIIFRNSDFECEHMHTNQVIFFQADTLRTVKRASDVNHCLKRI